MTSTLFFIALFFHLIFLIVGFGSVILIDLFGLLWMIKKVPLVKIVEVARVTQYTIWAGWFGLVASGLVLITQKGYLDNLTQIKLFFVVLLGLNGIFLHFRKKEMEQTVAMGKNALTQLQLFRASFNSFISQLGWWSAIIIGFAHRHIEHTINWPSQPILVMVVIILGLLILGSIGELIFKGKK